MTSAREMLEQLANNLQAAISHNDNTYSVFYVRKWLDTLRVALALPADDDVGGARTAEVPGTGAGEWLPEIQRWRAILGDVLHVVYRFNQNGDRYDYERTLRRAEQMLQERPVTNARDVRASDNNGEARDAERWRLAFDEALDEMARDHEWVSTMTKAQLKTELERAYRALHAFRLAHIRGKQLPDHALAYHSPTIAAAARWVNEQKLDGSEYFIGKHVSILQAALEDKP